MKTVLFLLTVLLSAPVASQAATPKNDQDRFDPCHVRGKETSPFFGFDQFDRELRAALNKKNAVALSFLVEFPLRVNSPKGTVFLADAQAIKGHFDEVFTDWVIADILASHDSDCQHGEEIRYSRGVLWVGGNSKGYAIKAVNPDAALPFHRDKVTEKINFVCRTDTHRIAVDTTAKDEIRYRAWKRPRTITDKPDLELVGGDQTWEGTNVCAVPIYIFKRGNTTYRIDAGTGCENAPVGATGHLLVEVSGETATEAWCY